MSTLAVNAINAASGGTVTITGAALTTPALGTPASGTLTNCTGFPVANLSGTTMPSAVVNSSLNAITPSGGALDVSGNLGLGAVPAAWDAQHRAIQFQYNTSISSYSSIDGLTMTSNGYASDPATWKYLETYPSAQYQVGNGQHRWLIAPSGTAGNAISFTQAMTLDASSNLLVGVASGSAHTLKKDVLQGIDIAVVTSNVGGRSVRVLAVAAEGWNTADAAIWVGKNDVTNRGINSGGTINASGADAAEYECNGGLKIAKGQIVGFGPDGVLTDRFDAAIRFGVKSTDPHIVGGDTWGTKDKIGERPEKPAALHEDATEQEAQAHAQAVAKYQIDIAAFSARLEAARQQVDRIAYCGKVPCNVTGAAPGDYIVAVNDGSGGIKGLAVRFPTFDQYRAAVGRVNRILSDGRAEIAVIVH